MSRLFYLEVGDIRQAQDQQHASPVTWVTRVTNVTSVPSGRARNEAGRLEAAMWRHSETAFRSSAWRQVDSPSRKYASSVVPSQTIGQRLGPVHAQAIKSDLTLLQSTIKLFVWAGISIKTFGNLFLKS